MTELILKYVNIFTFPVILLFAVLIPEFVTVVYTNKWSPAIPAFYAYSLRMIGSNFTTLFVSVLNALGMVKKSLRILIWWTLLDWILSLILIPYFGFTGIALAYGISVIPISIWLNVELNRAARIRLGSSFYRPLLLSVLSSTVIAGLKPFFLPSWASVIGLTFAGLSLFILFLLLVEREIIVSECRIFLSMVLKREN